MHKTRYIAFFLLLILSTIINAYAEEENTKISGITQKQRVVVLMYHHILANAENNLFKGNGAVISLESFKEQMKYLYDKGYNTITMNELENFIYYKWPLPKSKDNISVLITFDDGYLSNYTRAYPVLKKYGFKATVFTITDIISQTSIEEMNPDKLETISLEQMMDSRDVFDYESHSHAFHRKDSNNVSYLVCKNKDEVREDLQLSIDTLGASRYFAYPYGEYDDEAIDVLKMLGFRLAFTIKPGYVKHSDNPYTIHRFGIFPWTSFEQFRKIFDIKQVE